MTKRNELMKERGEEKKNEKILFLVCGLPGTGKSVVARYIAKKTNSLLLNTDVIRKKLFKKPKYSEGEKGRVYDMLFKLAEKALKGSRKKVSKNVVLDGTFYRKILRERAKRLAEKVGSKFVLIEVVCSEEIAKQRLEKRAGEKSVSDADFCVYKKIKEQFEAISEKHFVIDTGKAWKEEVEKILERFW